jgi:hypothetical protein
MPLAWIAANPVASAIGGSALLNFFGSQNQAGAATNAANQQYAATQDAARQQREMFDILNKQQEPYRQAGYGALSKISGMLPQLTELPAGYKPFTAADLQTNLAPNYEFMKGQGLGATRQALNVGGGGSNVERGGIKFAEDYASNAYQNALDNYMKQQTQSFNQQQTGLGNVYNRLAGIAGIGQTAVGQTANLGTGTAANLGQLGIGGASALGAGQIGAANAMAGGYQGIGNAATLGSLLQPQGYTANQIAAANATNVPMGTSDLGFSQFLKLG